MEIAFEEFASEFFPNKTTREAWRRLVWPAKE